MVGSARNAFLAPDNFLGWTVADVIAVALAVALTAVLFRRSVQLPARLQLFARNTRACMALLFGLPIALRLSLLPHFPVPIPSGADDFGYLLLADTLRHGRLANPPNGFPDAFAQIFVLQSPAYAAIFPLGQGAVLGVGWMLFGHPWIGVLLAAGACCALMYWMLRAWVSPAWSLVGGLLAAFQFGPLCYWMNCYWGGYLSAIAGCLCFGGLGRLRTGNAVIPSLLVGCGIALQALSRPYETTLLLLSLIGAMLILRVPRIHVVIVIPVIAAALAILMQNRAVTGHWNQLPYSLYRYEYGIPATFTFQPNAVPHAVLNQEQELDFRMETAVHGDGSETLPRYFRRILDRVRFLRFFWSAPLLLAFVVGWWRSRARQQWACLFCFAVFAAGSNFYPYFYPHYIAAVGCLLILAAVFALQRLPRSFAIAIVLTCWLQFAFWYAVHLLGRTTVYEAWDYINSADPQGRSAVAQMLAREPGRQLVFVHDSPEHGFVEWIHNVAEPATSSVIWVHDLGRERNAALLKKYAGRHPWLLRPDEQPPALERYQPSTSVFEDVR